MAIGIVALLLAMPALRADQDLQASSDEVTDLAQDITAADVTNSEAPVVEIGAYFRDFLTGQESDIPDVGSSEIMNILNTDKGLEVADTYDLDIPEPDTNAAVIAVPSHSKQAGSIPDLLVPAAFLLLGTALTTFALFTRRTRKHSRRAYFSRHFFIARPPSRSRSLRTSPSADSSEPSPSENSGHSSPRRRLA
jgi:hypothetical protein